MSFTFNPFTGNLDNTGLTLGVADNRYPVLVDSREDLEAIDPAVNRVAFSSDYQYIYIYTDGYWYQGTSPFTKIDTSVEGNPDMGVEQNSSPIGVYKDMTTWHALANCWVVEGSGYEREGVIRKYNGEFQIYLNSQWNSIVINFRFREDSTGGYELEHNPVGLDYWYQVATGNSDELGLDGKPMFIQYDCDMGCENSDLVLYGGDF